MKILVVDDSATMRRILINSLKKIGFENVEQASDGLEAQKVLNENSDIELALVDWTMPNMNGFEFLEATKADDKFKNIPIIMVTTEDEKKKVIKAIKSGAANYIVKPFIDDDIKEKIASVIDIE